MLEQATTFRPLVKEFCAFTSIASRAGKHDIADIVGTTTGNRYDVLNVALYHLLMTVIALALLPFVLCLYLLRSITSTCRKLTGTPVMLTGNVTSFTTFTLLVTHLIRTDNLRMLFFESVLIGKNALTLHFIATCKVGLPRRVVSAIRSLLDDFTMSYSPRFLIEGVITNLADFLQSIAAISLSTKVFGVRWFGDTALPASQRRGYTVHDKGHSLSGLGCYEHRQASSCITPTLYHRLAYKASL